MSFALPSAAGVLYACPSYVPAESARWACPLLRSAVRTLPPGEMGPVLLCLARVASLCDAARKMLLDETRGDAAVLAALDALLPSARAECSLPAGLFLHALVGGSDARMAEEWGLRRAAGFLYGRHAAVAASGDVALVMPDGSVELVRGPPHP